MLTISVFNYILNSIKTGQCFCSSFPHTMNRISNSAIFFFANKLQILEGSKPSMWSERIESYCSTGVLDTATAIGVFHGVAGVAHATPGLMELPSTGKGIEVSR